MTDAVVRGAAAACATCHPVAGLMPGAGCKPQLMLLPFGDDKLMNEEFEP